MAAPSENLERIVHKMKHTEKVCDQLLDENHAKNEEFLNSTFAKLRKRKQNPASSAGQFVAKKPKMALPPSSNPESGGGGGDEEEDYSKYSYAQIRTMCKEQGLPGKGKREVLEERLMQHFRMAKSPSPIAQSSETAEVIAHAMAAAQAEQARLEQARLMEEERIRQAEEEEQAEAARLAAVAAAAQQERLRQQALALEKAQRDAAALEQALKEEQEAVAAAAEEERLAELNRQMRSKATAGDILKKLVVAPTAGSKLFATAPAAVASGTTGTSTPGGRVFVSGTGGSALASNKSNLSSTSFGGNGGNTSLFKPTNASQNQSSNSFAHDANKSSSTTMASFLKSGSSTSTSSSSSFSLKTSLFDVPPGRVPAPSPAQLPEQPSIQREDGTSEYQLSDPDDYKSESESDSDSDSENKEAMQKVPSWAKGEGLKQALKVQYERYQDLDEIFPDNRNPVEFPLEEIFKKKIGMRPRSSSAIWTHDAVTTEQRLEYQNSSMKPPKH
ncbi:hypothetical protein BASA81_006675 [Batrachochytrium salamandrivorans]|nr:hypothetical protein BASA81_006675 [Batrachochytrium salamandrivorans]